MEEIIRIIEKAEKEISVSIEKGELSSIERDLLKEKLRNVYELLVTNNLSRQTEAGNGKKEKGQTETDKKQPFYQTSLFDQIAAAMAEKEAQTNESTPEIAKPAEIKVQGKSIPEPKIPELSKPEEIEIIPIQEPEPEKVVIAETVIPEAEKPSSEEKKQVKPSRKETVPTAETIAEQLQKSKAPILADLISKYKKENNIGSQLLLKPIKNIKTAISLGDRIIFTKELFGSDSKKYEEVIEKVNSCNNLDEAMALLDKSIIWSEDKDSFKKFMEIIFRRFITSLETSS